jgi:hypothetical protein
MSNPSMDWGSKTFRNISSLLGTSDAWKKYFPGGTGISSNFTPEGSNALSVPSSQIWNWAAQTAASQPADQTGLTPWMPSGFASPITAQDISNLQTQNAIFNNFNTAQTKALEQGYQSQLMNNALKLRSQDLTNQLLNAANNPMNIAARGATLQGQMATASNAEANMLDAVQRASYNSKIANATGIAAGAKA